MLIVLDMQMVKWTIYFQSKLDFIYRQNPVKNEPVKPQSRQLLRFN